MSVLHDLSWRLPGCDERCWMRRHDPHAHEEHGRRLERQARAQPLIHTGPLTIDLNERTVWVNDTLIRLTPSEWDILAILALQVGHLLSSDEILYAWRGDTWIDRSGRHLVRVNIARLRAALGNAAPWIETRPMFGYRLRQSEPCTVTLTPVRRLSHHPQRRPDEWSVGSDHCLCCLRNDRQHWAHGLCHGCHHHRTPEKQARCRRRGGQS